MTLAQCHTAQGITAWVNDRLAEWTFHELASIDEPCRPRRARDIDDIAHWHGVLTESYCAGGALRPNAELHQRMMDLFAAAHARAMQLGLISATDRDSLAA
jgi:hypothetical protein